MISITSPEMDYPFRDTSLTNEKHEIPKTIF